jgi:cytochrome b561
MYDRLVRALHWTTAILLVALFGLGVSMTRWVADDQKIRVYGWHEWIGLTVFGLTALRLIWRLWHPAPPIDVPRWERLTATVVYIAIYLILLVQPIVGWLMSTAYGFPVVYLGLVALPTPVPVDRALAERLDGIHVALALTLAALVAVHVAGVLYHHLVRRDALLRRMLAGAPPPAGIA